MAFLAAKWVLLAGVLATVGFGCSVEVIKNDGEVVNVLNEDDAKKARDMAADAVKNVKDTVRGAVNDFEKVVSKAEGEADGCCCEDKKEDPCCCEDDKEDSCCCDEPKE